MKVNSYETQCDAMDAIGDIIDVIIGCVVPGMFAALKFRADNDEVARHAVNLANLTAAILGHTDALREYQAQRG